MAQQPAGIATDILGVIATILPLLVVLIQFTARYYTRQEAEHTRFGGWVVRALVVAVIALLLGGFGAGEAAKQITNDPFIATVITSLEVAFVAISFAAVLILVDVSSGLGSEEDSNTAASNDETTDSEDEESRV